MSAPERALRPDDASLLESAQRLAEAERHGDVRALEQIIAPDYAGYDPAGRHQDRAGVLRAYTDGRVPAAQSARNCGYDRTLSTFAS